MRRLALISSLFLIAVGVSILSLSPLTSHVWARGGQQLATSPSASDGGGAAGAAKAPTKLAYPEARKVEQVDDYFGTMVADPYRWLEDENSAETKQWVEDENRVTFAYLNTIPYRAQIKARLEKLEDYPRFTAPSRRGEWFFFSKNEGLQNQNVQYMQKGLNGAPELLLDPNKLSADGTSKLAAFSLSRSGKYLGYGVSQGGSDWSNVYLMEVATRKTLSDKLEWIKASAVSWRGDEGFYYSRYPAPEKGKEMTTKNEFQKVYFHKVGTQQSDDELVYEDKANPLRFQNVVVTEDDRFAVLSISDRAKRKGNSLSYRDLSKGDKTFSPIVADIGDDTFRLVDEVGGKFLLETNHKAPNGRLILFDPMNHEAA